MTPKPDPPTYELDRAFLTAYQYSRSQGYHNPITRLIAMTTHLLTTLSGQNKISRAAMDFYGFMLDECVDDIHQKGGDNDGGLGDSEGGT